MPGAVLTRRHFATNALRAAAGSPTPLAWPDTPPPRAHHRVDDPHDIVYGVVIPVILLLYGRQRDRYLRLGDRGLPGPYG
jgi:hypothetical protein